MPIEFRCPHCDQRLQTPDGTQGRPTRCPACEKTLEVPWRTTSPDSSPPESGPPTLMNPPPVVDTGNPFQAPTTVSELPPDVGSGDLRAQKISAGQILNLTWEVLRNRLTDCLVFGLILVAVYFAGTLVNFILSMAFAVGGNQQPAQLVIQNIVLQIWGQVFGAITFGIGLRYALNLLRGATEPMRGAFDILPVLWRMILVQLVIGLVFLAVMMILLVPMMFIGFQGGDPPAALLIFFLVLLPVVFCLSIYVWTRFSLAMAFVVDRRMGVFESISESLHYTRGNVIAIFGAFMSISLIAMLFTLFTCLIGSVVAFPAIMITMALTYLLATGQPYTTGANQSDGGGSSPFAPSVDRFGE